MTNEPSPKRRRIVKQYALRIDQVPFDKTYESLCDELKSLLVGELEPGDDVNFVLHFLCRRDENFSCATATFHAPISAGELATELNSACIPRSYHFDADFQGITPLYESPKGADVDVIAVPGLASHAIGSWKSRNGQDVWLRDYLPHDIDGIRVLIYGYNTSLLGSASKESIVDLGTGFLDADRYQAQSGTDACLKSLAFEDMDGRQAKIVDAVDDTCKWLLYHETVIEWTRQHRGILWIKGKPGSGKTTLMKYALDALPSLYGTDTLAISFFFHGRGHELQKNPIGLFRSLLHQLLKRVPGALPDLIHHFEDKRRTEGESGEKWQWHLQPLKAFLKSSLPKILKKFPVMLFIDAVDECGETSAVELIGFLKRLLLSLPPADYQFGICFSCRHYPILELDGGSTILLDIENAQDIATFVQGRSSENHLNADIARLIINRAQGVFMWVHIVLKKVLQMHRNGESTGRITAEIGRTPEDLTGLYHELIKSLKHQSTTLKLIQWICFSTRPLRAEELQWAMAVDPDCSHKSLDDCRKSDDFITDDKIERRINALSGGLAEIVSSNNDRIVQFTHQSVKDFFVNGGLKALDNTTKDPALVAPVAHYSLIDLWVRTYDQMVLGTMKNRPRGAKLICVISRFGLLGLLSRLLEDCGESGADVNAQSDGRTPLSWAAEYGHLAIAKVLLATGKADVDRKDDSGRTPLSYAAEKGHETIVELLLATGKADSDLEDEDGWTPLSWAAEYGHLAVVELLLVTGKADVDRKDNSGRTPLSYAAENGHEAIIELLLETGKVDIDLKDEYGRTPLSWAASFSRRPRKTTESSRMVAHHRAKGNYALYDLEMQLVLLEQQNKWRLMIARRLCNKEAVVRLLLDTGKVDINSRDKRGRSPLSWAAGSGDGVMVKLLVDTGRADVDTRDIDEKTPLLWAAIRGHEAVVKLLVATGKVDVDARDKSGRTPLLWATIRGHEAVARLLSNASKVNVAAED
ncbi:hypothetical protein K4F52_007173 [Lecanicillium sp. MT-2017a]|nr:hypothetical protein K4F52_007173 [Lecanicillium sp. MT-2017a]